MDELSSISLSGDGLHVECSSLLRTLSGHLRQYLGSVFDRWRLKFQATRGHAEHHSSGIIGFARRVPVRSSSLPVDIRHHIRWSKSKDPCECMRCSSVREMSTLVPTKNYCFFFFLRDRQFRSNIYRPNNLQTFILAFVHGWLLWAGFRSA